MYTTTDSNGRYNLSVLPGYNYRVLVIPSSTQPWQGQWFDNDPYMSDPEGKYVTWLSRGGTANFALQPGASLGGTVTFGGKPVAKVSVELYTNNQQLALSVTTGVDGKYQYPNVAPGTYTALFVPPKETALLPTYFGNSLTPVPFTVVGGKPVVLNATMLRGATITGRVSTTDGTLYDPSVEFYPINGNVIDYDNSKTVYPHWVTGLYTVVVKPGTYRMRFDSKRHTSVFNNGATSLQTAPNVVVGEGTTTTVSAVLSPTVTLSGKVTAGGLPLGGVVVAAVSVATPNAGYPEHGDPAVTDKDGNWTMPGLRAGKWHVYYYATATAGGRWKNVWDNASVEHISATTNPLGAVDVKFPGVTTNIDLTAAAPFTPVANGAYEAQSLVLVNKARSAGRLCGSTYYPGVGALKYDERLGVAARAHSAHMAYENYISHGTQSGEIKTAINWISRAEAAGYGTRPWVGENAAQGYSGAEAVMDGWLHSPGHCSNIMNPSWTSFGIGTGATSHVQVFGKDPAGLAASVPPPVSAVKVNNTVLSWETPLGNGGSPILRYIISDGTHTWTSTTNQLTLTGFRGVYNFTVRAVNAVGTGAVAAPTQVRLGAAYAPDAPDTPTLYTYLDRPGGGAVQLEWEVPLSDGGAPILGYRVTASPGGATCVSTTTGCTVVGLTNGKMYTFVVQARNSAGYGAPSPAVRAQPYGPPAAVTNLRISAWPAAKTVRFAWGAPVNNGGRPVQGYQYRIVGKTGWVWISTPGAQVGPLKPNTTYVVQVVAYNMEGPGAVAQLSFVQRR